MKTLRIEVTWKTIVFATLLTALVVFGASDRALVGFDSMRNLNGTPYFINTITDTAGSTPTELFIEPGANVLIICTGAGYIGNIRAADANAVAAKMQPCSVGEKVPLGFLTDHEDQTTLHIGGGYVSYEAAAGTTSVQVFRYK